ncbi:MAG: D-lyxose/D-mannose family sugar isomerase [Kiritimatiellaeota bacterium]|nr:D-lyxose/D-mannose family sugar isomerase [Kiritimatiellota bacterium]
MKRSEINALIREAKAFFAEHRFAMPPFAFWSPEDWRGRGTEYDEIRDNALGWDLTDFGSGDFLRTGLLLFTLRNGKPGNPRYTKTYAEKIMIVREGQITPMHFHWKKMEDIINRGGGTLVLELYRADPDDEGRFWDRPFDVGIDGVCRTCRPGERVRLGPGSSICLEPFVYHAFWAEGGTCLVGEVSKVNDDNTDNRFYEPCGRFPAIEEDEPPLHLLCNEYPPAVSTG